MAVDYGAIDVNGYTVFTGSVSAGGWCASDNAQMLVGDFDSDGKDDLVCHDHATGSRWIDRAYNGLGAYDASFPTAWCPGHYARLHVGRLDSTAPGDDLLCHDTLTGQIWIDATPTSAAITGGAPIFSPTDTHVDPWCHRRAQRLFVADVVNTNSLDELVCHDSDTGGTLINEPTANQNYPQTSSTGPARGHCTGPYGRLKFGDFNNDGRDDLLCFDQLSGERSIDYASVGTVYGGVEWTSTSAWCPWSDQSLH